MLAVISAVVLAACSSDAPVGEPAPDSEAVGRVDDLDAFLVGTVWVVDRVDGREPITRGPSLTFTTGEPLDLTVVDACGSAHFELGLSVQNNYPITSVNGLPTLCDVVLSNFFRQAEHFAVGRGETLYLISGGSTMRASHVISESMHGEDVVAAADAPWCTDVVPPRPVIRGDLAFFERPDDAAIGVLHTYGRENSDHYGGFWVDRNHDGVVVIGFTDDPAAHRSALAQRSASADDLAVTDPPPTITDTRPLQEQPFVFDVVQVDHTADELEELLAELEIGPGDGLSSARIVHELNRVVIDFVDPPSPLRFVDQVESLPPGVCVGDVWWTPYVPEDLQLLDSFRARFVAEGVEPAELSLAEVPDAESSRIELLVWPRGCSDVDLLRGPEVVERGARVGIAVAEVPATGRTCFGRLRPVAVTVVLERPLGSRQIFNAGLNEPIELDEG